MLVPGVTYTKTVRWAYGGPLVTHVISAPPPGGLYDLKPTLSDGDVLGAAAVSSIQRRRALRGGLAAVNADFFNLATGRPSGVFMRDGVLASRPLAGRSTLGIAFDGTLRVQRLGYSGSWQVDGFQSHPAREFNRPLKDPPGVTLFTGLYGGATPRAKGAVDVVLARVPQLLSGAYVRSEIVARSPGGGTIVPRGGAVLQARGFWGPVIREEARVGRFVTVHPVVRGLWADTADVIGGGPALVRDGKPVWHPNEVFTHYQLALRHPRTAVGQLSNGRVIFVVVDGRSSASLGLRNWQMALEMVRLGAVTATGFDGGGSSTMVFDGHVLNRPSDGSERAVADALLLFYYGAYAPRPPRAVVSPNGDGVLDTERLRARISRRSSVDVRLARPDGAVVWRFDGTVAHRVIRHDLLRTRRSGTWSWVVEAVDGRGRRSRMVRKFLVNNTLGYLALSRSRMRLVTGRTSRVGIRVSLTRRSDVSVLVRRVADGRLVRRLFAGEHAAGSLGFTWDGRTGNGYFVRTGSYRIVVRATNSLGAISLERRMRVLRVRPS
jgi:phosphodiester glycosidase/flagellar hook capping protein FlgD